MLRWLTILSIVMALTALMTLKFIPTEAVGLARALCGIYAALLALSLVIGILRRS